MNTSPIKPSSGGKKNVSTFGGGLKAKGWKVERSKPKSTSRVKKEKSEVEVRSEGEKIGEKLVERGEGARGFQAFLAAPVEGPKGIFYEADMMNKLQVHELLQVIVLRVIEKDGVNVEAVREIRQWVNIQDVRHKAHVNRILDLLEKDVRFRKLIEGINAPESGGATDKVRDYIRFILGLGEGDEVTKLDAQRAVLGAVLSDLRQGNLGSCYGTGIAICVHDEIPHLMVEDLGQLVEKGYFIRRRNTPEGKVEERFYMGENFSTATELSFWQVTKDEVVGICERLANKYPEFRGIFLQYPDYKEFESDLKSSELGYFSSTRIDKLLKSEFGITKEDIEEVEKLKELSDEIRMLSAEASLNNDKVLDKKVEDLIKQYLTRSKKLGEKRFQIESYYKARSRLENILYMEKTGISLLTKGWEYAIASSELREIERENELRPGKTPPMMREMFKEALFSKDRGALFIGEMDKALAVVERMQVGLEGKQRKELSKHLLAIVERMKSVMDERMRVSTYDEQKFLKLYGSDFVVDSIDMSRTAHVLEYVVDGKIKVIINEKEYASVVLACMMEAFERVGVENAQMDQGVKDFLESLKGILGDKLETKEFRDSVKSFLANTPYFRGVLSEESVYNKLDMKTRVFPVYFEQVFTTQDLPIEREDTIVEKFLNMVGYVKKMESMDREDKFIQDLKYFADKTSRIIDENPIKTLIGCSMMTLPLISPMYLPALWIGGGVMMWMSHANRNKVNTDTSDKRKVEILTHFIEANRKIYDKVENHDEWVKYPVVTSLSGEGLHLCTIVPFNKTVSQIVKSGENIGEYISLAMKNPEKTTIAVMDTNWNNECYVGFELGGGGIRSVYLNSKYEVVSECPLSTFFASLPEGEYEVIDKIISHYKSS